VTTARLVKPSKEAGMAREALGITEFRIHRYAQAESEFSALGRCLEKQGRDHEANGPLQAGELAQARPRGVPVLHSQPRVARPRLGSCPFVPFAATRPPRHSGFAPSVGRR
jgi:hypothetical protein